MSSQDQKPKHKSWWGPARRDMEGIQAARARAEKARQATVTTVQDVGFDDFDESKTPLEAVPVSPIREIDTGITHRIESDDDMLRLFVKSEHNRAAIAAARQHSADLVMSALGEVPPAAQMSKLEKTIRRLRWVITIVAIPAISGLIIATKYIWNKAVNETRAQVRIERMVEREEAMQRRLDELERALREVLYRREAPPRAPLDGKGTPPP